MCDPATRNRIVFNGEIYNFRALRAELGGEWSSQSDTEVILRAYSHWGMEAFRRLRGMFALALWDEAGKQLVLARDPYGIKPLYFLQSSTAFLFGSEVRALLATGLVPRRLSAKGLESYLRFGSVQEPHTLIDDIVSMAPGSVMTVCAMAEALELRVQKVAVAGQPGVSPFRSRGDAVAELRTTLEESVKAHLVSDVPILQQSSLRWHRQCFE